MSDEADATNDAASDGIDKEDGRASAGRTAVVTRPQRPTGKRLRQRPNEADDNADVDSSDETDGDGSATTGTQENAKPKKPKKPRKPRKAGDRPANPFVFVYNYLKQVVAEIRKVIWPSRKQMLTYTSVVLAFLAFMVAVVGLADFGLTKLVLLVFG